MLDLVGIGKHHFPESAYGEPGVHSAGFVRFRMVGGGSGDGGKALTSADFLHGSPIVRADLAAGRAADAFHVLPVRTGAGFNQPRHCWTGDAGQRSELVVRQFFELEVLG